MSEFLFLLLFVGLPGWLLWSAHKAGKREGSRKAYGVGRRHGRRRR